jgi:hypothetical protein
MKRGYETQQPPTLSGPKRPTPSEFHLTAQYFKTRVKFGGEEVTTATIIEYASKREAKKSVGHVIIPRATRRY